MKELWDSEIKSTLQSLHFLNKDHLFSSDFQRMNIDTAVQLFSVKTAGVLEKAVGLQQVSKEALSEGWWIHLMAVKSRLQGKCGITKRKKIQIPELFC